MQYASTSTTVSNSGPHTARSLAGAGSVPHLTCHTATTDKPVALPDVTLSGGYGLPHCCLMPLHLCSLWGHLACGRVNTRRSMCGAFSSLLLHSTSASNTYEFSFQRLSTPISTPVNTTTVVEPQPNPTACALRCMPRRVAQPRAGHVHSHMTRCKPCRRPAYR